LTVLGVDPGCHHNHLGVVNAFMVYYVSSASFASAISSIDVGSPVVVSSRSSLISENTALLPNRFVPQTVTILRADTKSSGIFVLGTQWQPDIPFTMTGWLLSVYDLSQRVQFRYIALGKRSASSSLSRKVSRSEEGGFRTVDSIIMKEDIFYCFEQASQ
jgi:hypothetical protein